MIFMEEEKITAIQQLRNIAALMESGGEISESDYVNYMFEQNGKIYWAKLNEYIPVDKWMPEALRIMGWEVPSDWDTASPS